MRTNRKQKSKIRAKNKADMKREATKETEKNSC
jgi:hypothetical protein